MKNILVLVLLICWAYTAPAFAHNGNFLPLGWSGAHANGHTGNHHPEDLCKNFTQYTCMIAGVHNGGIGLGDWPVRVRNSFGSDWLYTTNTANTRGWIVVIGAIGSWNSFEALPGSNNGVICQFFGPGIVVGTPAVAYGSQRYYYQSITAGQCF